MSATGVSMSNASNKDERLEQVSQQLYSKPYGDLSTEERLKVGSTVGGQKTSEGYSDTVNSAK